MERELVGEVVKDSDGQAWVVIEHHLEADEIQLAKVSDVKPTTTAELSEDYSSIDNLTEL